MYMLQFTHGLWSDDLQETLHYSPLVYVEDNICQYISISVYQKRPTVIRELTVEMDLN